MAISDYLSSSSSLSNVASKYGFTGGWLRKVLIRNKIKVRGKSEWKVNQDNQKMCCIDYKNGMLVKDIASKYSVSRRTITEWLKTNGITPLKLNERMGITNDMKIKARGMYQNDNLNCVEIGKILKVSHNSVLDWVNDIKKTKSEISCILSQKGKKKSYGKRGTLNTKFGLIRYDSSFERDRIIQLCNNDNVISLSRCNYFIKYGDRNYNPDFILKYKCGCVCVEEIKPIFMLKDETNIKKFMSATNFCLQHNILFSIITEKEIYGKK